MSDIRVSHLRSALHFHKPQTAMNNDGCPYELHTLSAFS